MEARLNMQHVLPEVYKAMLGLEKAIGTTKLDAGHKHLIKIRASQINGCAYCINMHTRDARKAGETEQRIYLLNAWNETSLFTEEEKVILAVTEEVTHISHPHHLSDETYNRAKKFFDEEYIAAVIMCVVAINAWNRIAISSQTQPD